MARPLRIQEPGLTYHVTARGNGQMDIYLDDVDRLRFLTVFARVVQHFGLRCHAYCLMSNHYHAALTTTDANLSRAIKQLNGEYAQWWNWRHRHVGHVFQGRFGAQIVQDDMYLLNVCRYVVLNPVRAGLVRTPAHWRWSSYLATAGIVRLPSFLHCDELLERVSSGDAGQAVTRYRVFVLKADARLTRLSEEAILGDEAFVARFQPSRALASREVPRREGRRPLDVFFRGAITRTARNAGVIAAFRERYALAEIARYLEVHPSTISRIVSAHRGQVVRNVEIQDLTLFC
jgi:REP element-mobilizing transposase RayT